MADRTVDAPSAVETPEQLAAEALVPELWRHPIIQAARQRAGLMMLQAFGNDVPAEAMRRFDEVMDEYTVSYLNRAISRNPAQPHFVWNFNPPFARSGRRVLGSRFCGDNPDAYYRFTGIDPGVDYVVRGRPAGPVGPSISFNLVRNWGGTDVGPAIDLEATEREADGSFLLTLGPEPANGRPNHLQTDAPMAFLMVRECIADWEGEVPLHLRIERKGSEDAREQPLDEMANDAARWIVHEIPLYFWMIHLFRNLDPNTVREPLPTADYGGHGRFTAAQGFCRFEEDEAVIIRWDPADADYSNVVLNDWWFRQIDAHRIQSTLNTRQAAVSSDGSITAIVAARDPGIANWLDTGGLHDLTVSVRWHGLPEEPRREGPTVSFTHVKLSDLSGRLPDGTDPVAPEDREKRNAARRVAFAQRIGSQDFELA